MGAPASPGNGGRDGFLSRFSAFSGNDAMKILTMYALLMGTLAGVGKRKRRSAAPAPQDDLRPNPELFYKVINDLDEDDCLAVALCHVSSKDEAELPDDQQTFLRAFSLNSGTPMAWEEKMDVTAKYHYASYVGKLLKGSENRTECGRVFSKCHLGPDEILDLLTVSTRSSCPEFILPNPGPTNQNFIDETKLKENFLNKFLGSRSSSIPADEVTSGREERANILMSEISQKNEVRR